MKKTIGKIQLVFGVVIIILGLFLIFFLIPKITEISLFSPSSTVMDIATPKSMQGYDDFSNETKAILEFEHWNLFTSVLNLFVYTKLLAILLFVITILFSIILILEGLVNIANN